MFYSHNRSLCGEEHGLPEPMGMGRVWDCRKETDFWFLWWLRGGVGVKVPRVEAGTDCTSCWHQGGAVPRLSYQFTHMWGRGERAVKHQKNEVWLYFSSSLPSLLPFFPVRVLYSLFLLSAILFFFFFGSHSNLEFSVSLKKHYELGEKIQSILILCQARQFIQGNNSCISCHHVSQKLDLGFFSLPLLSVLSRDSKNVPDAERNTDFSTLRPSINVWIIEPYNKL